jgi:transcriptional regulator with XRE-family HTH domain
MHKEIEEFCLLIPAGGAMNQLLRKLRDTFVDEDYRYAYADSFLNSYIAAQIKTLRELNALTREELAHKLGTRKGTISRMEDVSYDSWTLGTLKILARTLGVRLKVSFEEFGTLVREIENFSREELTRMPFDRDPVFLTDSSIGSIDNAALELQKKIPQAEAYPSEEFALGGVYDNAKRRITTTEYAS